MFQRINPERIARKQICKVLGITNKRFRKWNKKSRKMGQNFFVYNPKTKRYEGQ